jgi:lysophospholipase L1-like esterase
MSAQTTTSRLQRLSSAYRTAALLLLNTVLLLLLIESCSAITLAVAPRTSTLEQRIARFKRDVVQLSYYQQVEWAAGYWDEHMRAVDQWGYMPYTVWRSRPFSGQYINIDADRLRVTPNSQCEDANAYRVYVFGGSTIWGYGAPDANTIPANLAALYAADVRAACVVNYGDFGFNSTQSLIQLLQLLQAGDIPDVVIFYDGANDVTAANRTSQAGAHFFMENIAPVVNGGLVGQADTSAPPPNPLRDVLRRTNTYHLLIGEPPTIEPNWALPPLSTTFVDGVVDVYLNNVRIAHTLSEEYGFAFAAFVQPVLPIKTTPLSAEEQNFLYQMPGGMNELFLAAYPRWQAATADRPYLHYMGNALDDETQYIMWIDFNHLSAWGNLAMADRIYRVVAPFYLPTNQ